MGNHDQFGLNDELLEGRIARVQHESELAEKEPWRIVPDNLREREPLSKGRTPKNPLSRALLNGSTIFISGPKKTFGSLYNLAKNHNKKARVKRTRINDEEGSLVWFEEIEGA